ncbi:hypothetical protein ACFU8W_42130 [Streptomyces sp. NPDC057565]|uniref:hypothetical protein n=1 Tax=Streptomyces sp. NPDC057565 TaxID=3346169 RepID=UPI0036A5F163
MATTKATRHGTAPAPLSLLDTALTGAGYTATCDVSVWCQWGGVSDGASVRWVRAGGVGG